MMKGILILVPCKSGLAAEKRKQYYKLKKKKNRKIGGIMEKVKVDIRVSDREMRIIKKIQKESKKKGVNLTIDEIVTKLLADGIRVIKKEIEECSSPTSLYGKAS
jgi:chorismate mutase